MAPTRHLTQERSPTQTASPILILSDRGIVRRIALVLALGLAAAGCSTASPSASASGLAESPSTPASTLSATEAPSSTPSPTPEPSFSIATPPERDERPIRFSVAVAVPAGAGGRITVKVTNLSTKRIDEIVLRWSTAVRDVVFLQPFRPSKARIVDGGPPLRQEWTKWVEGPGAQGEPAGTTSLGYGPIDAGVMLTIPLEVSRNSPGPITFDLQFLSGEKILSRQDGTLAETRAQVP